MGVMRPDRGIVKKAIEDAGGNLTKAAVILGCSRTALYTWIYQLGLERVAGVRIDNRSEVDNSERKYTRANKHGKPESRLLTPAGGDRPILRAVMPAMTAPPEIPVQATMRLPEALWKRAKIEAIRRGCNVSDLVREALEAELGSAEQAPAKARGKKGGEE